MPQTPDVPPLSDDATKQAGVLSTFFHERLKAISQQLAKANGCELTLRPHVNLALKALKEAGLDEPPPPLKFHERPDFRVGAGSLLMGLSLSLGGFAMSLIGSQKEHPIYFALFVVALPILMAVGGFCWAWTGWVRSPNQKR